MVNLKTDDFCFENIETILFDKDGTFIDLHYFWGQMTKMRANEIIEKFSLNSDYFEKLCLMLGYNPTIGKMLSDGITALYSRSKIIEIFRTNLLSLGIKTSDTELTTIFDDISSKFYENIHEYTKPIPEAIGFIKKLRKTNVKLGIVTSDSKISTMLTLKNYNWEHLFDVTIGREDSPHTKESGEPTKLALKTISANPKTTIMIGDAPMDYISAKNAGIAKTILVASGQIDKAKLKNTSEFVVNSLSEIEIY